ncbi:MAG TPA: sensor domain-containing diguanylate cyclase [Paraburkholderia sp.]|nr:sensor domain-containing diguanylate cyclase [Paraburkholderia sp.]
MKIAAPYNATPLRRILKTFTDRKPYGTNCSMSSRRALILVPALTVLVLAVLWTTILVRLRIEKAAVMHDTRVAVQTLADALDTHTLKTIHDVDEIALLVKYGYESAPQTFDLAKYRAYGLITADTALQVTLVGADGHVIDSTLPFSGAIDLSDREHFRVHRLNPDLGLFISQPVIGRISRQWSIQATRRINRPDGSFGGVVVVSEDPAWLTDGFYTVAALGEHGMIAVLSGHGFMLSRRAGEAPSRTGDALPTSYIALHGTGTDEIRDPIDHVERVVATRRVGRYDLSVVAGLSVDEALDDYVRMRQVYVTMAAVISLLLTGLSSWITALLLKLLKGREQLQRQSQTDRLTGLPNRGKIMDLLDEAVTAPGAVGRVAVIFIDLDRFKELNDTYGHQSGDAVLVEVAQRLLGALGADACLGRLGGDEFLVVIRAQTAGELAARMVNGIAAALALPVSVQGHARTISASVGAATLESGDRPDDLVRKADIAMYEAKERARARSSKTGSDYGVVA